MIGGDLHENNRKHLFWFLLSGFTGAIGYFVAGIIWCITIIGIPFGKQCFKLAKLSAVPFGKVISE